MPTNGFEQLLINHANEELQRLFNDLVFRGEEAECAAEDVACVRADFPDAGLAPVALLSGES